MTRTLSEHMHTILFILLLCMALLFWTLHVWQLPMQSQHNYTPVHHMMSCPPPPYDC